jgi:ribosome-associated translation inhibitor RaiA
MQVLFDARDPEGAAVRPFAERRVRFALRRLSWLVPRARVQLSDVNGPRGGIDKCCRIELDAAGAPPVLVTALARDWRRAIDEAVSRAARTLLRARRRAKRHELGRPADARLNLAAQGQS